ncbi:hypothetical protein KJ641_04420, partial [Patescibacteria group bacterium]|nr:hypothetical protein [Patescibacteria group bacterium]
MAEKIIKISKNYWKQASMLSILLFCGVWYFTIGFGSIDPTVQVAKAASLTWVGGTTGTWETGSNWSGGVVPTDSDDVTIVS